MAFKHGDGNNEVWTGLIRRDGVKLSCRVNNMHYVRISIIKLLHLGNSKSIYQLTEKKETNHLSSIEKCEKFDHLPLKEYCISL